MNEFNIPHASKYTAVINQRARKKEAIERRKKEADTHRPFAQLAEKLAKQ